MNVTVETLFDAPRHVIVHLDGREYAGEVCKPKQPSRYAEVVWLSNDGFDRREFTKSAVVYALNNSSWLYG